jgi:hypothetical protein
MIAGVMHKNGGVIGEFCCHGVCHYCSTCNALSLADMWYVRE